MQDVLENLNEAQRAAVTHTSGPLLIIAGAGTGKTTVITRRIAWLIAEKLAKPEQILALTFTEKAADEMSERVDLLLPMGYVDLSISTFHAFAEKMLSEYGMHIGVPSDLRVIDETAACLLMRRNWSRFELRYFRAQGNPAKHISDFFDHFSNCGDFGIEVEDYQALAKRTPVAETTHANLAAGKPLSELPKDEQEALRIHDLANAYATYRELKREVGALDFSDLMLELRRLLRERPAVRETIQKRFTYLLVDEFQDTNAIQYEIVKLLLGPARNVTVVGDDDQAIYRFRGASLMNLMQFVDDYPDAKKVVLTENYRSRQEILDLAYTFISKNNPHRLEAKLAAGDLPVSKKLTGRGPGGKVHELVYETEEGEASGVAETIAALKAEDADLNWYDFCILVRANSSAVPFVQALEKRRIPFRFYGLRGLYTKAVVLDALAMCRVAANAYQPLPLSRLLLSKSSGLDEDTCMKLFFEAEKQGKPLYEILKNDGHEALVEAIAKASTYARTKKPREAFLGVLNSFGYLKALALLPEAERTDALAHVGQLYEKVKRFEEFAPEPLLSVFLMEIDREIELGDAGSLKVDVEDGPDVVKIMTVHSSKGLEFEYVFVAHLVEQRFPAVNRARGIPIPPALIAAKDAEHDDAHVHEERRLMYVALTRAKRGACLSRALDYGGERKKKPSRFLEELGFGQREVAAAKKEALEHTEAAESVVTIHHPKLQKRLSFTQLVAFQMCPLQYKFAHVYHVPIVGNPASSFGKSMHATLQKFLEPVAAGAPIEEQGLEKLLELYRENWLDDWYPDDEKREEYRALGEQALRRTFAEALRDQPKPKHLELPFTIKIGEFVLKGRIDRVDELPDGTLHIIDYKTGKPKTAEQVKKDREIRKQLILYTIAAEEVLKLKVSKASYEYLEDGSRVTPEITPKDQEKLREEILETAHLIAGSEFPATPGFHCRNCDFRSICEFREV